MKFILHIVIILILVSCTKNQRNPYSPEDLYTETIILSQSDFDAYIKEFLDYKETIGSQKSGSQTSGGKASEEVTKNSQNDDIKNQRNSFISRVMSTSDIYCNEHHENIIQNYNLMNLGFGVFADLTAILSTITDKAAAKTNFAAASAFASGTQAQINNKIYLQTLAHSIVEASNKARSAIKAKIKLKMDEYYDKYSSWEAIIDLNEYHNSCSFYFGIMEIQKAIIEKPESFAETKERLKNLQTLYEEIEKSILSTESKEMLKSKAKTVFENRK
ncbi:hypothetical protein OS175_12445 [Marinicella sp. S1101]|uniref:hypothetical protein n=1 Tax=Marinicella marina TaxID=2996016 RepID=UPI002260D598|nr:hypothetical protein [Marinicella marina]MCX7554691.1 hypothetical protein [Marinicella marina]MDJ1141493.1 hypothetical protein [Marinicella marina]